jgi:hypothetical protein
MSDTKTKRQSPRQMIIRQFEEDLEKIHEVPFETHGNKGFEYFQSIDGKHKYHLKSTDLRSMGYDSVDVAALAIDIEDRSGVVLGESIDISPILDHPDIWLTGSESASKILSPANIIKFAELQYKIKRV